VFYYRATECNATQGIAVAIMSVRLSVSLSEWCHHNRCGGTLQSLPV